MKSDQKKLERDKLLFKEKIQKLLNKKIRLKINDNKTVFLSAKYRLFNKMDLSLHKCFMSAPDEILEHLKKYLLGKRKKESLKHVKNYVEKYFLVNRKSYPKVRKTLLTEGNVYNLQKIFDEMNNIYFGGKLKDISITWTSRPKYSKRRSITFGSFDNVCRNIKINKVLDSAEIPLYFISFIVYHEILHDIYPVEIADSGRRRVHTKKFKEHEKLFIYYNKAKNFEKTFMKEGVNYGWT